MNVKGIVKEIIIRTGIGFAIQGLVYSAFGIGVGVTGKNGYEIIQKIEKFHATDNIWKQFIIMGSQVGYKWNASKKEEES